MSVTMIISEDYKVYVEMKSTVLLIIHWHLIRMC